MTVDYRATLPDKAACFRLFESTGWNDEDQLDEDEYFAGVRGSWHVVSAYEDERLVGLGRLISDGVVYALIVDLIVLPAYRGRGIGSGILRRLLERCQASDIRNIQLFAAQGMAGFYRRHGFVERPVDAPGMRLLPQAPGRA
jgi:GNAT superfamily N-acetyltransferase